MTYQSLLKAIRLESQINNRNLTNMDLWTLACEVFVWRRLVTLLVAYALKKTLQKGPWSRQI